MPKEKVTRVVEFSLDEVREIMAAKLNINLRYKNMTVNQIEGPDTCDGLPGYSRGPFAGLRVTITDKENAN